jgi:hypothetical protein
MPSRLQKYVLKVLDHTNDSESDKEPVCEKPEGAKATKAKRQAREVFRGRIFIAGTISRNGEGAT